MGWNASAKNGIGIADILNGVIDLGEMVAETLALDLDPYPRKPGVSFDEPAPDEVFSYETRTWSASDAM